MKKIAKYLEANVSKRETILVKKGVQVRVSNGHKDLGIKKLFQDQKIPAVLTNKGWLFTEHMKANLVCLVDSSKVKILKENTYWEEVSKNETEDYERLLVSAVFD